jgi:3-oxoisoapionate decarboxylase
MNSKNFSSPSTISRRQFIRTGVAAAAGMGLISTGLAKGRRGIKLGFDNFSIRGMEWNAGQVIDYAALQQVDTVLFSDLKVYENHDQGYLRDLKSKAADHGIDIQAGTYSICPTSAKVTKDYGTPEEHLALCIRIATAVGSPVVRCVLGNSQDRLVEGGIEAQIASTVKVLKKVRTRALDAGIKIAVENHSGDMQAWELVTLIEDAGKEFVGATIDSGNATFTLEDPLVNLEILAPYVGTTGIRDTAVWETPEGVDTQWTAMGEGNVDWQVYMDRFAALCPGTPLVLEIISEYGRSFPYLKPEFWKAFPKVRGHEFARFIALAKKGKPKAKFEIPSGPDRQRALRDFQLAELERSLRFCKMELGLGLK